MNKLPMPPRRAIYGEVTAEEKKAAPKALPAPKGAVAKPARKTKPKKGRT